MVFSENHKLLGDNHLELIEEYHFLVVGLGGLGGYIANALTRLGAKYLTLVDFDVFQESNLNRQLFSNLKTLNQPKIEVVKEALLEINPNIEITTLKGKIEDFSEHPIIKKSSLIFDSVDNIKTRLWLEDFAKSLAIPIVHGAIGGWYGQVAFVTPGSGLLHTLYGTKEKGVEKTLGSPTFIPPIIANLMVTEAIKWMHKLDGLLEDKLLFIDIKNHLYQIVLDRSKK